VSESNFRLVEHNVELNKAPNQTMPGKVIFRANEENVEVVDQEAFWLDQARWLVSGSPETIYVTVTAVLPTSEPADEVEVFRSASTGEFVSEEFAERNPSTTIKHSR